jgi:tryptophan 2,3-dioxygenase
MTPSEYSRIRPHLGSSSGFQSYQYRQLEFILGNKNPVMVKPHAHRAEVEALVRRALEQPALYDEAIRLLVRRGFEIDPADVERDWTRPRSHSDSLARAWIRIYRQPDDQWDLYQLAEEFIDLEDAFRQWRFRHVTTVERIIGFKPGTGGTVGVAYLRKMLDVVLFPELWKARTEL